MEGPPRRAFPLVPRLRLTTGAYGSYSTSRRGHGADVAGSRTYRPGDRLGWIDWKRSARLSSVQGNDEFVVREFYADEAPRVIVVADHHPSMSLYPAALPWLSKREALRAAVVGIIVAAHAARAQVGYLDFSGSANRAGAPYWLTPSRLGIHDLEDRLTAAFDAPADVVEQAIGELLARRHDAPPGCFLFFISDFLRPPPVESWLQARAYRWDVVPVIIQDPIWEQSFPLIGNSVVPVADPVTGHVRHIRLTPRDARQLHAAHAARLSALTQMFRSFEFDPVVLGTSDVCEIDLAFQHWADRRRSPRRRAG